MTTTTMRVWMGAAAVAVSVGACSPPENQFSDLVPIIVVDPDQIAFGEVGVAPGLFGEQTLFVSNVGKKDLEVRSITLEGQVESFTLDATSLVVGKDEAAEVAVRFAPTQEYRDYAARILIESDDEDTPLVVVPVTGRGTEEPLPNIEIRPSQTLFSRDDIEYGESDQLVFDVHNTGQIDLTIEAVTVEVLDGAPASTFTFEWEPSGAVAPGGHQTALVRYTPDDEVGETALVHIESNDPDTPDQVVYLHGMGGGPYFGPPEAVIDCPAQVLLTGPVYAHFDGSLSIDPSGFPLTYQWSKVLWPAGSDTTFGIDPATTPEIDLYVDLAGTWTIQLIVTNSVGAASVPALCVFDAVPEDNIHVELRWADSQPDFDLHLRQNGFLWFEKPEDCMWCNKTPDWGVASLPDDDPRLDIDDKSGFGPENINIFRPADGLYSVGVHLWNDHGTPNDVATVSVWLDGVEVYVQSMAMSQNEMWEVGSIYVASGVPSWTTNGLPPADAGQVQCPL